LKTVSVILTVHNKESLLQQVMSAILDAVSSQVKEVIVVLDGCTDNSENIVDSFSSKCNLIKKYCPNVFETIANNVGLKSSSCDYSLLIQDDMILNEKEFDQRILIPFQFDDVLGVSAKLSSNDEIRNNQIYFPDGSNESSFTDNEFVIRDVAIRGPLMLDNFKLEKLNYLDEDFAPFIWDDHDLCIRGFRDFGWMCGFFKCNFLSDPSWGTTRIKNNWKSAYQKNEQLIIQRHSSTLSIKHNEERICR